MDSGYGTTEIRREDESRSLTAELVAVVSAPTNGRSEETYYHATLRGFGFRVSSGGKRAYFVEAPIVGKTRQTRYTFADAAEIKNFKLAMEQARVHLADMHKGIDPRPRAQTLGDGITFATASANYMVSRDLRPATQTHYAYAREVLDSWASRPLHSITQSDVKARMIALRAKIGAAGASQVFRYLRSVWNFTFLDVDPSPICPTVVLTKGKLWIKNRRKKRVIPPDKLPQWWDRVAALPNGWPVYFYLQVFTGGRRTELRRLDWQHVDLTARSITFPGTHTKNHETLILPLGPHATLLLENLKGKKKGSVFGSETQRKRHVARLSKEIGFLFGSHDLRRMFRSVAMACEIPDVTVKTLLNHSTESDVTDGYAVPEEDVRRSAMEKIEREFLRRAMAR